MPCAPRALRAGLAACRSTPRPPRPPAAAFPLLRPYDARTRWLVAHAATQVVPGGPAQRNHLQLGATTCSSARAAGRIECGQHWLYLTEKVRSLLPAASHAGQMLDKDESPRRRACCGPMRAHRWQRGLLSASLFHAIILNPSVSPSSYSPPAHPGQRRENEGALLRPVGGRGPPGGLCGSVPGLQSAMPD